MQLLQLDTEYPELWRLSEIARIVRSGGMGVIPTDTSYAFVCGLEKKRTIERLYRIKDLEARKTLSILCRDLPMVSDYTRSLSTSSFRTLKRCLPGPYTFILKANREVPKIMLKKRRTIGIRIPDDPICATLAEDLDAPLIATSVRTEDDSYWNDPEAIARRHGHELEFLVDGGTRVAEPSTVVDLSDGPPEILRAGKGDTSWFE